MMGFIATYTVKDMPSGNEARKGIGTRDKEKRRVGKKEIKNNNKKTKRDSVLKKR